MRDAKALELSSRPKVFAQNVDLQRKNKQLTDELEVVKWYIEVFEEGNDTREILNLHHNLSEDHRNLVEQHKRLKISYDKDVKSY